MALDEKHRRTIFKAEYDNFTLVDGEKRAPDRTAVITWMIKKL